MPERSNYTIDDLQNVNIVVDGCAKFSDLHKKTVGVFVYWYGPVRTVTKSIRLLVLL
jgi:hypothetical protein